MFMKKIALIHLWWLLGLLQPVHAQFFVSNGSIVKTTGGAIITLQDIDLVNNGTINQQAGEGGFRFTGSTVNSISGTNIPLINELQVAKTGNGQLSLQQSVQIATTVNFTSGLLNLGNSHLLLEPGAQLQGESENSRIFTTGTGTVRITTNLNAPNNTNPGNLGLLLTSTQNLGSVTIARGHGAISLPTVSRPSILRYFDIVPANNTNLNANIRIQYFDAELNGRTESQLSLWRSSDFTNWTGTGFTSRDATANFVQLNNIPSITRYWTLTDINFPTSVFDRLAEDKTVRLWPNPIQQQQQLFVQFSVSRRTHATLRIIDAKGTVVSVQAVQLERGVNTLGVPFTHTLAGGVYTLQVVADDGSHILTQFIKQ